MHRLLHGISGNDSAHGIVCCNDLAQVGRGRRIPTNHCERADQQCIPGILSPLIFLLGGAPRMYIFSYRVLGRRYPAPHRGWRDRLA